MTGLRRDRLTLLVYGHLVVYGFFLYGFGPAVPLLGEDQGVSRAVSGLHGTALAAGAVLAGLLGAAMVGRWGRGRLLRAGLVGIMAGIVLFTATTALPLTLLGALVAGTSGSVVINSHSPVLSDHHGLAGPAAISEANALAAATGMLAPLVMGLSLAAGPGWRAGLLVAVVLAAAVLLAGRRVPVPDHRLATPAARRPVGSRLSRRYWAAWLVLVLSISVEFTMVIWSAELMRDRTGLSAGAATASITAVVAGMTAGRFAGSRLALRHSPDVLLLRCLALTFAGFAVFWVSSVAWLSLAGLVLAGLGISLQFPLGITRAIRASDGRPDLATARASLGAGLAIGSAPFLLGYLADRLGAHVAFLLVPALLAVASLIMITDRSTAPAPVDA